MSTSIYGYFGWYVIATTRQTGVSNSGPLFCPSNRKHRHGNGKFCSQCGTQLAREEREERTGFFDIEDADCGYLSVEQQRDIGEHFELLPYIEDRNVEVLSIHCDGLFGFGYDNGEEILNIDITTISDIMRQKLIAQALAVRHLGPIYSEYEIGFGLIKYEV